MAAIALALAVAVSIWLSLHGIGLSWFSLIVLLVCLALWWGPRQYRPLVIIVIAGVTLGVCAVKIMSPVYLPSLDEQVGETVTITGKVISPPDRRLLTTRYILQYCESDCTGVLLTTGGDELQYGEVIEVTGQLQLPEPFESDTGREFAYDEYLATRGVGYVLAFPREVTVINPAGWSVRGWLLGVREAFLESLERHLPEPGATLASGLTLGVRGSMPAEIDEAFRDTGLIHIVVLSGSNVALVIAFFYFLCQPLPEVARRLLVLLGIVAFVMIVGAEPPILRAALMAIIGLFAITKTTSVLQGLSLLALAATLMMLWAPRLVLGDVSFILSLAATIGIISIHPWLVERLTKVPTAWGAREIVGATVATQIAVLPILLVSIGSISLISPLANLLVLPLVPIIMGLTALVSVLGFLLPAAATLVSLPTAGLLALVMAMVKFLAAVPYAAIVVPVSVTWPLLLGTVLFVFSWWWLQCRRSLVKV